MIEAKIRRAARARGLTGKRFDRYVSDTMDSIGALGAPKPAPKAPAKPKGKQA